MVRQSKFEIEETEVGPGVTLAIAGDLDLSTIPLLTQRVDGRLAKGAERLTLDLGELTFMDSSGLRMLIELSERAKAGTWELALLASKHEAANLVLRMTGADTALPFEEPTSPW
jgi:anti-sigma B factor antagonist